MFWINFAFCKILKTLTKKMKHKLDTYLTSFSLYPTYCTTTSFLWTIRVVPFLSSLLCLHLVGKFQFPSHYHAIIWRRWVALRICLRFRVDEGCTVEIVEWWSDKLDTIDYASFKLCNIDRAYQWVVILFLNSREITFFRRLQLSYLLIQVFFFA